MTWRSVLLPVAIAALLQSSFVSAQQRGPGPGGAMPPLPSFATAPKIGERLPDLTIVDDQGNPVSVREIAREHYTVLVLGCLT